MTKTQFGSSAALFAASLAVTRVTDAHSFNTERFDVKRDDGTDHVAVEAITGRAWPAVIKP